jgi:signal transduction histidine kinase
MSKPSAKSVRRSTPKRRGLWSLGDRFNMLGFNVQMSLIVVGSLLSLGVVILFGYAVAINNLKDRLMGEAKAQADEARIVIERVIAESDARSVKDVVNHPDVKLQLRILTREGGVVMAAIAGEDGKLLIQQYGSDSVTRTFDADRPATIQGILPKGEEMNYEIKVEPLPPDAQREKVPLKKGGLTVGYMEYGLSEDVAGAKLQEIGRQISRALSMMVFVILALIVAATALLQKAFRHHLLLQRTATEAEHLAHIGTLASGLAHEIRNPLHAMNLHLEVAKEELEVSDGDRVHAATIVTSVQKHLNGLNTTLTHFLHYALPQKLEREVLPLDILVNEVVGLLRPELDRRNVSVEYKPSGDINVLVDSSSFRQVITNIILNAAQILEDRERREVTLWTETAEGEVLLHIDDTGPGIPIGEEDTIFEAFVSHRKGGTGFGLAIARRVIEEHDGRLWAETRPEGGARFSIALAAQGSSDSVPRGAELQRAMNAE